MSPQSHPFSLSSSVVVPLLLAAATASASADVGAATCDRLRAEARSEAALLYAPRLELEGARAPIVIDATDPAARASDGLQARVALALSPVDMLRGRAVQRVAAAECARIAIGDRLDDVLTVGARYGQLAATRAELAYLDQHLPEIDALITEVAARFERQRATALEVDDLRTRRTGLRARVAELRQTRALLEALDGDVIAPARLDRLATDYRRAALDAERRRGDVRTLAAWRFDVRAGVAGGERTDWYAVAAVGYSFGQPWQRRAERQVVAARADELDRDPRGVAIQLDRLRTAMRDSVTELDHEQQDLDTELAELATEHARLGGLDGDAARQLRARVTVARIELGAHRASVVALATARRALAGVTP